MLMQEIAKCNDRKLLIKAAHAISKKCRLLLEIQALEFSKGQVVFFHGEGQIREGVIMKVGKRNMRISEVGRYQKWTIAASLLHTHPY